MRVPVGVAIGVLLLGETLPVTAWIGLAFVVAGVAAMTVPGAPRGGPPAQAPRTNRPDQRDHEVYGDA